MVVDINSIEAYYSDSERLGTVRDRVRYIVENAMKPSSTDIARLLNIQRTSVTGRLKELEQDGIIYKAGTKQDPWTHKRVWYYAISEESQ